MNLDKIFESGAHDSLTEIAELLENLEVIGESSTGKIKFTMDGSNIVNKIYIDPDLRISNSDQVTALITAIQNTLNDGYNKVTLKTAELLDESAK